jgi:very-short-patch-repair endonuclease
MKKHRKEMTKKIKNLRSNNSKEFWKLMRKGTYRKFSFFKFLTQCSISSLVICPLISMFRLLTKFSEETRELMKKAEKDYKK